MASFFNYKKLPLWSNRNFWLENSTFRKKWSNELKKGSAFSTHGYCYWCSWVPKQARLPTFTSLTRIFLMVGVMLSTLMSLNPIAPFVILHLKNQNMHKSPIWNRRWPCVCYLAMLNRNRWFIVLFSRLIAILPLLGPSLRFLFQERVARSMALSIRLFTFFLFSPHFQGKVYLFLCYLGIAWCGICNGISVWLRRATIAWLWVTVEQLCRFGNRLKFYCGLFKLFSILIINENQYPFHLDARGSCWHIGIGVQCSFSSRVPCRGGR